MVHRRPVTCSRPLLRSSRNRILSFLREQNGRKNTHWVCIPSQNHGPIFTSLSSQFLYLQSKGRNRFPARWLGKMSWHTYCIRKCPTTTWPWTWGTKGWEGEGGCTEAGVQGSEVRGTAGEGSLCLQPWVQGPSQPSLPKAKGKWYPRQAARVSSGRKWRQGRG